MQPAGHRAPRPSCLAGVTHGPAFSHGASECLCARWHEENRSPSNRVSLTDEARLLSWPVQGTAEVPVCRLSHEWPIRSVSLTSRGSFGQSVRLLP